MPTLGLAMIVKNGGEDLRHCLRSVAPIVQQMAIADTGSTDGTREMIREFGATLVDFPWTNHYAEARNASLAALTTDWVLVLDADEELDAEAARRIPALLGRLRPEIGALRMWQRHYIYQRLIFADGTLSRPYKGGVPRAEGALAYLDIAAFRLFRRHPQIVYKTRIHEIIEPQVLAAGFRMADSAGMVIHHFGKLVPDEVEERKQRRYREMLLQSVKEEPNDARLWVQLAFAEDSYCHDREEAVRCYERALEAGGSVPDACIGLARIWIERKEFARALEVISRLDGLEDRGMLQCDLKGEALHGMNRLEEARVAYREALKKADGAGIRDGFRSGLESKLGYVEVQLGMEKSGLRRLRRALASEPKGLDLHDRLVKALVLLKRDKEAAEAAENICNHYVNEQIIARAAALRMRVNELEKSREILLRGLRLFPESEKLRRLAAAAERVEVSA